MSATRKRKKILRKNMSPEELMRRRAYDKKYTESHLDAVRASRKRWVEKNREARREYERRYAALNADKKRARYEKKKKEDPKFLRSVSLRSLYGIDAHEYDRLHALQNGLCAICDKPETVVIKGKTLNLSVDHCHGTGRVRALLCRACNLAVGFMRDDPELLEKAAEYVRHHSSVRLVGT